MGAYEDLFGDEGQKAKAGAAGGGAYDQVFGGAGATGSYDDSPDLDMSDQPMDVPRDPKQEMLAAILDAKKKYGSGTEPIERFAESALSTVSGPFKAAKGLMGVGKSAANEVMTGSMMSALNEIKNGADPKQLLESVLKSGATSGAVDIALSGLGAIGRGVGSGFEWAAKKAKNVVAGSNAKEARSILDKYGVTADTNMLGELLDKYSPSGIFSPKSAAGHLEQSVAPQRQVQGQRVQEMVNKAGYDEGVNDLVPDAFERFKGSVDDRALEAMRRPAGGDQEDLAAAMANRADAVNKMDTPQDLSEFVGDKSDFQASGAGDNAVGYSEKARAKADQAVGGIAKDYVAELMGQAEPGTFARWDNARNQMHELSMLQEVLAAKKAGESTAGDIGSTIGSGVLGAGVGATLGATDDHEGIGAAGGGAAGLLAAFGLTGGATKTAIRQLGGTGLADFGANVVRSGGNLARGIGNALDSAPVGSITAAAQNSRGHQSVQIVQRALQQNPAIFGKYASQLQNADDLSVEVSRLMDDEPDFKAIITQLGGGM